MMLDETGGPELVSPVHHDPADNKQHPLITNRKTGKVSCTGAFCYVAHFSKFVRPGEVHLGVEGSASGMRAASFERPGGGCVMEWINNRKAELCRCGSSCAENR
jgi:glucosylceramidase